MDHEELLNNEQANLGEESPKNTQKTPKSSNKKKKSSKKRNKRRKRPGTASMTGSFKSNSERFSIGETNPNFSYGPVFSSFPKNSSISMSSAKRRMTFLDAPESPGPGAYGKGHEKWIKKKKKSKKKRLKKSFDDSRHSYLHLNDVPGSTLQFSSIITSDLTKTSPSFASNSERFIYSKQSEGADTLPNPKSSFQVKDPKNQSPSFKTKTKRYFDSLLSVPPTSSPSSPASPSSPKNPFSSPSASPTSSPSVSRSAIKAPPTFHSP